jgi:hypothetical protein
LNPERFRFAAALKGWDEVLAAAEKHGLAVVPALGVCADRNDGSRNEIWHAWDKNPFSFERGGSAGFAMLGASHPIGRRSRCQGKR